MSAKNFMSSVLDELMGRNRNALPDEKPKQVSWDDPEICTHYLVCFCPNELFVNTKADLGTCNKLHDEQLRKRYQEEAPNIRKLQFESEFIRFADKMVQDIEAKIKRGKMRIALANGPDGGTYAGPGSKNAEKIALLTERVNVLLQEAEEAGCAGDIEKTQGLLKLCDQLKEEREQLKSTEVSHPWNPDKAMQVCEVCGSYLIIGEAQHRLDDHIMGKQHMGFALLRKTMDDVKKARESRELEERVRAESERRDRTDRRWGVGRDNNDKEKRERPDREKERNRTRSCSRERKKKDEKRKRSRSKSPKRRSRSRDRKEKKDKDDKKRERDSSKDRKSRKHSDDKDKKKSKRSRSRSRDKHRRRRSRSRDKGRDKDRSRSRDRRHKDEKEKKDKEKQKSPKEDASTSSKSPKMSPLPETSVPIGGEPIANMEGNLDDPCKPAEAEIQTAFKQCSDPIEDNAEGKSGGLD